MTLLGDRSSSASSIALRSASAAAVSPSMTSRARRTARRHPAGRAPFPERPTVGPQCACQSAGAGVGCTVIRGVAVRQAPAPARPAGRSDPAKALARLIAQPAQSGRDGAAGLSRRRSAAGASPTSGKPWAAGARPRQRFRQSQEFGHVRTSAKRKGKASASIGAAARLDLCQVGARPGLLRSVRWTSPRGSRCAACPSFPICVPFLGWCATRGRSAARYPEPVSLRHETTAVASAGLAAWRADPAL